MVKRDYTKEIGMHTGDDIVPLPYAIAVVAVVVAGGWFGVKSYAPPGQVDHLDVKKTSAVSPTPAPAHTLAVK